MRPCDPLALCLVDMASLTGVQVVTTTLFYTSDPWGTIFSQDRPFRLHLAQTNVLLARTSMIVPTFFQAATICLCSAASY